MVSQPTLWDDQPEPLAGDIRTCQRCGREYVRVKYETGTRYCGPACAGQAKHEKQDEHNERNPYLHRRYRCGSCATDFEADGYNTLVTNRRKDGDAVYVCADCKSNVQHVLARLRAHNAPADLIYSVARGERDNCPICGINITRPQQLKNRKYIVPMAVDHDHRCCPGSHSRCGRCIRALLCNRCNAAIGLLEESSELAGRLAAYLDRPVFSWQTVDGQGSALSVYPREGRPDAR